MEGHGGKKGRRNKNSSSWDSKMSVTSSSTAASSRQYRRSASSILSSDSDIRFTQKKLTSQCRRGCCVIATFLLLLLVAAAALYVGYTYFVPDPPQIRVYRGAFHIVKGDAFKPEFTDSTSVEFRNTSLKYNQRLNLLFRRSDIRSGFLDADVLALDGSEDRDLIVHFNVRVDPAYVTTEASDIQQILIEELELGQKSSYFRNLTIDVNSVEVQLVQEVIDSTTVASQPQAVTAVPSPPPPPPRRCSTSRFLKYCSKLGYNVTTYPNIFGHRNLQDVKDDVISFRELVDAECYRHAYEFVCQILQPSCVTRTTSESGEDDVMVLPCRSFCRDFMTGCGGRLSEKLRKALDCGSFPEFGGVERCVTKPGCVEDLQARALSPRVCDGVVDCQDLADEKTCTYCPQNYLHCGIGRVCIPPRKRCDGRRDCPDGSDERACLSLAPSVEMARKVEIVTPHLSRYHASGFVAFNEKGEIGKLCTENLNHTSPAAANQSAEILHMVAASLCKTLSYKNILSVQVEKDSEHNISYVEMEDPLTNEIKFIRTPCESKQVLKVACSNLECGIQGTHHQVVNPVLPKMAVHGDWPWHVVLLKEEVHVCDGTLISSTWVMTTTSCFQGQPKAEWTARFGLVRVSSSSPWEQERRIVGMVKSPVEGSTIALVKLDREVVFSDFVRPVCVSEESLNVASLDNCNALGWARNRDQLQRVQVKIAPMEKCENVSISTVNSLCADTFYGKNDCDEEEMAGGPMVCYKSSEKKWVLIGVTNWRIACMNNIIQRPRMYDKVTSNVPWIRETVEES